jgi:hypothetical protein
MIPRAPDPREAMGAGRSLRKWGIPFGVERVWHLRNTMTGDVIDGQFPPEEMSHTVGSRYETHYANGRKAPITQFVAGELEVVSFTATLYAYHVFLDVETTVKTLMKWAQMDPLFGRPPILDFWVGNSYVSMPCLLEPVTVAYFENREFGRMRGAKLSIGLRRYDEYNINERQRFDTRYHFVGAFDYFDKIAQDEYGKPEWGPLLAQRHPQYGAGLAVGAVVKLPAIVSLRTSRIVPASSVFDGLHLPGSSDQHTALSRIMRSAALAKRIVGV